MWPCILKGVRLILGHFLIVANFQRELPFLDFGFLSKSDCPVILLPYYAPYAQL